MKYDYLLHKDVWMPQNTKDVAKKLQKRLDVNVFSKHLVDHLKNKDRKHNYTSSDIYNTIKRLTINPVEPFEVGINREYGKLHIKKYCVRTYLNNTTDIIIVISDTGTIITSYLNDKNDSHTTLDTSRYYFGGN